MNKLFDNIYKNKKVFITGHTGFKGSWLSLWLTMLGADVCGYSLRPNTNSSLFEKINLKSEIKKSIKGNILDYDALNDAIQEFQPEIIFHLAAQPLVKYSYENPILTYQTNVIGTLNVLEAARKCPSIKAFINVTSDKCYENKEIKKKYCEDDELGGYDIYSSSKACSEILSSSYKRCFLQDKNTFALATVRAGNVIGGGDWAKDRLIPDCILAVNSGKDICLRNPNAIRPWQFVLEPLSGYLLLGEKLLTYSKNFAQPFNFGPKDNNLLTVHEITKRIIEFYGKGNLKISNENFPHESQILMLSINKAKNILNWTPTYNIDEALNETLDWYKEFYKGDIDMLNFTKNQISSYVRKIKWNKN